jgi:hypothetical protein
MTVLTNEGDKSYHSYLLLIRFLQTKKIFRYSQLTIFKEYILIYHIKGFVNYDIRVCGGFARFGKSRSTNFVCKYRHTSYLIRANTRMRRNLANANALSFKVMFRTCTIKSPLRGSRNGAVSLLKMLIKAILPLPHTALRHAYRRRHARGCGNADLHYLICHKINVTCVTVLYLLVLSPVLFLFLIVL